MPSFAIISLMQPFVRMAMAGRNKIEDRIQKKEQEIQELEMQIREARSYIQALQDVAKLLPRDAEGETSGDVSLRTGSSVADARSAILKAGKSLHIVDLLKAMGREVNRKNKTGVSGSLAAYVRRGEVFTRPKPNTFGLLELEKRGKSEGFRNGVVRVEAPPDNFGIDETDETIAH
jgi:hypothetical protein